MTDTLSSLYTLCNMYMSFYFSSKLSLIVPTNLCTTRINLHLLELGNVQFASKISHMINN